MALAFFPRGRMSAPRHVVARIDPRTCIRTIARAGSYCRPFSSARRRFNRMTPFWSAANFLLLGDHLIRGMGHPHRPPNPDGHKENLSYSRATNAFTL